MAIPHFNTVVSLDPEIIAAHRGLGITYSKSFSLIFCALLRLASASTFMLAWL